MGNTCELEQSCCKLQPRHQLRRQRQKSIVTNNLKIGVKDLVQVKKYPISKDYVVLSPPIGKGSFGSVYKIVNRQSGMVWAAKKIPIKHNMQKDIHQILILKQLNHPNIIRIIDVYQQQIFVYVVMEMCNGGELFQRIVQRQNMNEEIAKNYMQQLLSAVAYCHMNRIIHRDIKPQNIMLISPQEEALKIIDFGASTTHKKGEFSTLKVGSVYYIAPEVIKRSYNQKCDIWSLGVVMYMILSGSPPFNGRTDKAIFDKILQGKFSFPEKQWSDVSQEAKDLISKMLEYDPQKRLSARQALNHPWCLTTKSQKKNLFMQNDLAQIKNFCSMNKFKQYVMTFITHNLTTSDSLEKMRSHFQAIDANNDGRISWKQFEECYQKYMEPIDPKQLHEIFTKLDKNSSGFIDYSEFATMALSNALLSSRELIQKAFEMIDKDKDGFLDKQQILLALGGVEQAIYEQMLQECDTNHDGLISKQQFLTAILNISSGKLKKKQIVNNSTNVSN